MAGTSEEHVMNPHVLFGSNTWTTVSMDERKRIAADMEPYRPMPVSDTPPTSPGTYQSLAADPNSFAPPPSKSAGFIRASPHAAKVRAELMASMGCDKVQNSHVAFGDFNKRMMRELHMAAEIEAAMARGGGEGAAGLPGTAQQASGSGASTSNGAADAMEH